MALFSREVCEGFRIFFLCIAWYIISSSQGVLGKTILSRLSIPYFMTMIQLGSIVIYSFPLMKCLGVRKYEGGTWSYHLKMLLPLGAFKCASSALAHVSILKVPVSYAHTIKGTMPIFTVLITRVFLGTKHTTFTYLSLVPIVGGVIVATLTELNFEVIGFASALSATAGFAVMTIGSKQALKDTGMHHLRLLHKLGLIAAVGFLPIWVIFEGREKLTEIDSDTMFLLFIDGLLHFLQNILAFTLIKLVTSLTYAVANATKRIAVISVSLLFLKNPVTPMNVAGMALTMFGVFCYNRAKHQENLAATTLPTKMPTAPTPPYIWQNHITYDSKVQVAAPLHFAADLKRNQ